MEQFSAYGHAIVAVAATALIGLVLNPLSAIKKSAKGVTSGSLPEPDYADPTYRWARAYLNLTEMMGLFVGATVAAMLAGASPFWVNLLASLFLLSRLVVAVVHVRGLGKPDTGLRTAIFTVGWAAAIGLSLLAIAAVFAG